MLPRPGLSLQRVTFTEVTQRAVLDALQQPRQVSADLVDAYLARRALDYLVGYGISPVLWRKLGPAARSAGGFWVGFLYTGLVARVRCSSRLMVHMVNRQ